MHTFNTHTHTPGTHVPAICETKTELYAKPALNVLRAVSWFYSFFSAYSVVIRG